MTADLVPGLLQAGLKVVDFSADYRLDDPVTYREWYDHEHTDPTRLGKVVYGLPELFADQIRGTNLIANNGCYTATAILALAPLVKSQLIETRDIIIDAKSGVSGAGRAAKQNILYCECNESLSAYGVGKHRHTPEIEQIIRRFTGQSIEVIFTPHLVRWIVAFWRRSIHVRHARSRKPKCCNSTAIFILHSPCQNRRSFANDQRHQWHEFLPHHRACGTRSHSDAGHAR